MLTAREVEVLQLMAEGLPNKQIASRLGISLHTVKFHVAQILGKLARITGRKAPTTRLPYAVAYCAGACSTAWAAMTGKPPRVPLDAVRMARKKMWVTHQKAARELGFAPRPADQALQCAAEWFQSAQRFAA